MKEYLGDSVYAETDPRDVTMIRLTTENGEGNPSNIIMLELAVMRALVNFYERHCPEILRGWAVPCDLPDGWPCNHPGCLSHVSHPCEGCGRIAGMRKKVMPD